MRLKLLEVQGYKSFANKAEFAFDGGITAVVGPNGCGKSNVADAIRWVLGEQSYSLLRGKKTEDMIFSGSVGRARLGMAAATLVLDNADKWLPLDFSEVTISRRAYRSGENEYYLNGSRVRLKDINEILAKSGLGRQTYTVIGQGTIDRVLSLHADERRKLFEEAAGITFHRQKRAQTLAKLDETRANLLRLNDIVKEIEPQMKRLEKQALRADEYTHLQTQLDSVLRVWYGYRWGQGQEKLRQAKARFQESESTVEAQRSELRSLDAEIVRLRSEQAQLRSQLGAWYSENNQLHTQAETVRRDLAVTEERARQFAAQRAEILDELQPLESNLNVQQRQVAEAQAALQAINLELSQAEEAERVAQQKLADHQTRRQSILDRQAAAADQARKSEADLADRQARLVQIAERREVLQAEQRAYEAEISRLAEQQRELQDKQTQLATELAAIEGELSALETRQTGLRDKQNQLNQVAEQLKGQTVALERKEEGLRARQDLLGNLRAEMSGYYAGVRAVLQAESGLSGIIGPLSQVIQVSPELELAIEAALGGRLQDVVVDSFANAERAIAYLTETRRGRATFLPLDTIRPGGPTAVPEVPGVVGLASELVEIEPRLRPVVELTLNRTIIVDNLVTARRAFEALQGGFQIVTRRGEVMRSSGAVSGGRSAEGKDQGKGVAQAGTFLAREREWCELPEQIEALVQARQVLSTQLADNHDEAAAVKKEAQQVAEVYQQKDERRQEVQRVADEVSRSLEHIESSLGWQQQLLAKARAELERLDQRQVEIQTEMADLAYAKREAEELAQQLAQEVSTFSAENLIAELGQAKAALASVQGRQRSQQAILDSQQATLQQLATQIESKQARAQSLGVERETLLKQQQEFQTRRQEYGDQLAQFAEKIHETEQRLNELDAQQSEQEKTEGGLRQRLQWLEAEYGRASLDAARRQDELDNLQRQIQDDLGMVNLEMSDEQVGQPLLPIRPLVSDLPVVETLPDGVEEDVKRLKVQVRRLGSINPDAPREYAELHERHEFLTHQMADLEAAAADLKEIIAKLDTSMKEAFVKTFEEVAKEFQAYFKALFGGGEAQLLLTAPDDLIDTGVDIVARPPGKRLQSLALLSGGERSLTAQALIFALLKISPTPFVIFDEVDAMLDEANVGRFRDALTALARDIQFIIITHNRKTIEAANTIYGISMGDDSVSQVYSLRIDDWVGEET